MSFSFMIPALLVVSLLTNLTVEGIKKLLDESGRPYSSNILAVVISIVLACLSSIVYMIMNDIGFSLKIGVSVVVLMYLSFLIATVGYDKVKQTLEQIMIAKSE